MRTQVPVDPALAKAVNLLVAGLKPRAIILFGSRARGTHAPDSDYDLLVISDEPSDYDQVYEPLTGQGVPCDVVPCTTKAWAMAKWDAGGVLRDALDEGVLLYGQP